MWMVDYQINQNSYFVTPGTPAYTLLSYVRTFRANSQFKFNCTALCLLQILSSLFVVMEWE